MANKTQKAKMHVKSAISQIAGCDVNRWGHYTWGGRYRVKFNPTAWRFERKSFGKWIRRHSAYYVNTTDQDIELVKYVIERAYDAR